MKKLLVQNISMMLVLLKVKGIDASRHKLEEFVLILLYILDFNCENLEVYICIKCKLYLDDSLKANILIGNNGLYIESFLINFTNVFVLIQSSVVDIVISAKHHF